MFAARYAAITERLSQGDSDVWAVHDRALEMEREGADVMVHYYR